MTIMLARYSGFPPELYENGIARHMKGTSLSLYMLLMRESDRRSTREISISDKEIREEAGISSSSLLSARKWLEQQGLIVCQRAIGGSYTYVICDVKTRLPFPGPPNQKAHYNRKVRNDLPGTPIVPIPTGFVETIHVIPAEHNVVEEEVAFPYGHNEQPQSRVWFDKDDFKGSHK